MINFLWQVFCSSDGTIFFPICLINLVTWALGFLSRSFYAKKTGTNWLSLWFLMVLVVLVVSGFVLFLWLLGNGHGSLSPGFGDKDWWFVWAMTYFLGFVLFSWLGHKFTPKNKKIWLLMVLMFVGNTSCIFSIFWEDALEGGMRPFGKNIDSEISKQSLEDGSGFDYEMTFMEYRKRDLPVDVARFSQIRVKGDSAYYQTNCQKKWFDRDEDAWALKADFMHAANDSSQWILLDSEKTSVVKKLKEHIEIYEQEFSIHLVGNYWETVVMLDDFKNGRSRTLFFRDAKRSYVRNAIAIEKMIDQIK